MEETNVNEELEPTESEEEMDEEVEQEMQENIEEKVRVFGTQFAGANKLYYEEKFEEALETYNQALENKNVIKDKKALAKAMYWRAETLVKLRNPEEAVAEFQEVVEKFPQSNLGYSAQRRIQHINDMLDMMKE